MRCVFFDNPDDDSGRWETELSSIPRIGDMVLLPDKRLGKVCSVEWCFDSPSYYVEITLTLM